MTKLNELSTDPRWLSPEQRAEMRVIQDSEADLLLHHAAFMDEQAAKQAEELVGLRQTVVYDDELLNDGEKAERTRLATELAKAVEDARLLDWLEHNCDDLMLYVDVSAGTRVELNYCSELTGCTCEVQAPTLRDAIRAARAKEGE